MCLVFVFAANARAYQRYNDGCDTCHGSYTANPYASPGGGTWPRSLHDVHRSASPYMATSCDLCHSSSDGRNPYLDMSTRDGSGAAPGEGCVGCHGTVIGGVSRGTGLRRHHAATGIAARGTSYNAAHD